MKAEKQFLKIVRCCVRIVIGKSLGINIMSQFYISKPILPISRPFIVNYFEYCQLSIEKEVYCELPDDLAKGKTNLPSMTFTNVTASGTVSGATVSSTRYV